MKVGEKIQVNNMTYEITKLTKSRVTYIFYYLHKGENRKGFGELGYKRFLQLTNTN